MIDRSNPIHEKSHISYIEARVSWMSGHAFHEHLPDSWNGSENDLAFYTHLSPKD